MLAAAVECLACPVCGARLSAEDRSLRCTSGHAFDIARQGYVNLLPPGSDTGTADTAEMVAARDAFLSAGHYEPIVEAVAAAALAAAPEDGCVVDAGAGTGHYLARVLDFLPGRTGLALDVSVYALRRAARAHERIGAAACDTWGRLPVRDSSAALVLDVFAPRNAEEFRRILRPDGALVVVTPAPRHLAELVEALGLLTVDERKDERLAAALGPRFALAGTDTVTYPLSLTRAEAATLAAMGPSARHAAERGLDARASLLPEPMSVTVAVDVAVYIPA